MATAQQSSVSPFCYRPVCERPSTFNSPTTKKETCPAIELGLTGDEYERKLAEAAEVRAACENEPRCVGTAREPLLCTLKDDPLSTSDPIPQAAPPPVETPPPLAPVEAPEAAQEEDYPRAICLPPEAFPSAPTLQICVDRVGIDQEQDIRGAPQPSPLEPPHPNLEDTIPPRIAECTGPPPSTDRPGVCSSAEGMHAGEVTCCRKKVCEINPEVFKQDPNALPKPDGPLTSEYYKTTKLPFRFDNASGIKGYGCQQQPPVHPFYRTTSQDYGWFKPTIHSVPTSFFPTNQEFSRAQGVGGRYKNTSLDTTMVEKPVDVHF